MRRSLTWPLLATLAACDARISAAPGDLGAGNDAGSDPPADGSVAFGPWSPPAVIAQAASATKIEDDGTLSANALELIFAIDSGGPTGKDLFYTSRPSPAAPWADAIKLAFNSPPQSDETPRLSADDKTLFFASGRGSNGLDIYSTTRSAPNLQDWSTPKSLGVKTAQAKKWYMPCGTHYVVVQSTAAGDTDLFEGVIGGGTPTAISELNSTQNDTGTFLSADCLTIYFASNRPTSTNRTRLYTSTRAAVGGKWSLPTIIDYPLTGTGTDNQEDPWMSSDGRTFVFVSDAAGTKDLYITTRAPR
jgi:hypothetical protein